MISELKFNKSYTRIYQIKTEFHPDILDTFPSNVGDLCGDILPDVKCEGLFESYQAEMSVVLN